MTRRLPIGPSRLSRRARNILARTAAARSAIDAKIAGVELEGEPIELGPKRHAMARAWLGRDITKQKTRAVQR